MGYLAEDYKGLNPLKTDMYQLTMAQGYFEKGRQDEQATFYMHWRRPPFGGSYTVAAGLEGVVDFLQAFKFEQEHIDYLRTIKVDGKALYSEQFLNYLKDSKLDLTVDAVPEGTVMTGPGPVVRISGPLIQCQLVESAVLNIVNSASMVATRAARIKEATGGKAAVAEMSLRRAPTLDSGVSRAAHIGGAGATADVEASRRLGIPVIGTMAHSWIQSYQKPGVSNEAVEFNAFCDYMDVYPTNTVMLIDTFDPEQGIKNAIKAAIEKGVALKGVRLDSGDLLDLTFKAKELLDKAADQYPELFSSSKIYLTNDLDEVQVRKLYTRAVDERSQPLPDNVVFGVGTALGNPGPMGGVYKISAHGHGQEIAESQDKSTAMVRTMKVAGVDEKDPTRPGPKSSLPGVALDTIRLSDENGNFLADVITDRAFDTGAEASVLNLPSAVNMADNVTETKIPAYAKAESLLKPVFAKGEYVFDAPATKLAYEGGKEVTDLAAIQAYCRAQVMSLPAEVRRIEEPQRLPVLLDPRVDEERRKILAKNHELPTPAKTAHMDVLIDVQHGFSRAGLSVEDGGSLYVPGGENIVPKMNALLDNTQDQIILLSQDFHPASHISFMTNHAGVMQYRRDALEANGQNPDEAMSPLALPFNELVLDINGKILGLKEGDRVRQVELISHDGKTVAEGFVPSDADKGRISKVLDGYLDKPFAELNATTQMLWTPHCVQGTKSTDFDDALNLPQALREQLAADQTSPHLSYYDAASGNQFYVVRKGTNSELDSYGIGIENDKNTTTTAPQVFEEIARNLKRGQISAQAPGGQEAHAQFEQVNVNIGGLATNFCVEFSHNNIADLLRPANRMRGIETKINVMNDACAGIPIPGGKNDPFSVAGAPERMAEYDKGNPSRVTYTSTILRERGVDSQVLGASLGGIEQARGRVA
jgi:nicotinate phosphoribosyltransferase